VNQPERMNQPEELVPLEFEQELTQALRPVAPPDGFADRVLARLQPARLGPATPVRAKVVTMTPRPRIWASGALAATLIGAAFIGQQAHVRHQRQQAELAQQQFETAMQITDQTLEQTRRQLQQAGVELGN
jgi:hypothetical protein